MGVAHTRITLKGTLANGQDIWSTGFGTAPISSPTPADMEDLASTAALRWIQDYWTPVTARIPSTMTFRSATAAAVNAEGRVTVVAEDVQATPPAGGNSGAAMPPECAVVCSLITTTPGPRGRGRMYLPALSADSLTTVGNLDGAYRSVVLNAMQDFINSWNASINTFPVSVVSNAGEFVQAIERIRVGTVIDSQRRRRNNIPESYASAVITP